MDLAFDRRSPISLVDQLSADVKARIESRSLLPGAKLPSIRTFAESSGVSKSTVVEVYDRLAADGCISSRRGSGFYVTGRVLPLSVADIAPRLDRVIDPFWVSRQGLVAGNDFLKPGCGWLPEDWLPDERIRRALRAVAKTKSDTLLNYSPPQGLSDLRRYLARRVADYGVDAGSDQIIITDSATQAADLLCRLLVNPGDTVLVDDPCYFNFHALLRAHRANIVGVPFTPSGPDLHAFEQALRSHRPRLYMTNAGVQNPTGATLSLASAHRVLKLAAEYGLQIIEDDVYADFEEVLSPRLSALDGLNRVILIGSFSKTLSAAVRCGYIAIQQDWVERLIDLKIATSVTNHRVSAELLLHALRDGSYRRHISSIRNRLSDARNAVIPILRAMGLDIWIEPDAGMFLWCRLPSGVDAAALTHAALAEGVILAPGNVFSLSQSAGQFIRMNVAQCADPRIFEVISAAMHQQCSGNLDET